ncbi:hypothetical protein F2Q70_00035054 [Brassica cretica]|uniref:Copine C-terminal domain-containing protein n=1 Tax=Brassica cretica TaxID=69181 RepID=A0A8S9JUN1_BRACR|nr:hypothetical protein F2Q70_00035054 [Brassica cretica]
MCFLRKILHIDSVVTDFDPNICPKPKRVSLLANNVVLPLRLFIRRIMEQYLICIIIAVINPHSQSVSISRSTEILGLLIITVLRIIPTLKKQSHVSQCIRFALSILIVGVGDADFKEMDKDDDETVETVEQDDDDDDDDETAAIEDMEKPSVISDQPKETKDSRRKLQIKGEQNRKKRREV